MTKRVFGKATVYCNDIGCYTLGYGEPMHACDVLLCMGSSISQASGIARTTGHRTVAFIGDSTFFHSGLPALVNAVQAQDDITVVILDNYVTAMTGFQPSLTSNDLPTPRRPDAGSETAVPDAAPLRIGDSVRGLGVKDVYSVDPFDEEATLVALRAAQKGTGVNVVICRSPCVVYERRTSWAKTRTPFVIDQEKCDSCSLCVRVLGCPGILVTSEGHVIDQNLCVGCALCARVCNRDAIQPADRCREAVNDTR